MAGDLEAANLEPAEYELLKLCGQLTRAAYQITDEQVESLRGVGWSDEEIAEAVLVAAMFAMFNRVADAFGLKDPGYFDGAAAIRPATDFESQPNQES